ncbi:dihydroorotase family protein [Candidatus Saccharibacteria bacterium]|nr:dihydroorotase family protein [Candidatus Saccharibacteria bacterium]
MSETLFRHPGAVDLHDHFRAPSEHNNAEDFQSGTQAAAIGGYVIANDMPNTPKHETWTAERVEEKYEIIERDSYIPTGVIGGMQPEADNLTEIPKMVPLVTAFKQYYTKTQDNDIELGPEDFREGTEQIHVTDPTKLVMAHAGEDIEGIIGMVAVDTKQPLHFCHVNSPETVRRIQSMERQYGLTVTKGVTPHHLFKSSFDTRTEGWFARMQPPLTEQGDAEELFDMLVNGDIDIVETDHAPHSLNAKQKVESENPTCEEDGASCFGVTNIEFALPMLFYQAKLGRISMERLVEVTSTAPARIIGVNLSDRTSVDWDLSHEYRIGDEGVVSGSRWTPFQGKLAVGKVIGMKVGEKTVINQGLLADRNSSVVRNGSII